MTDYGTDLSIRPLDGSLLSGQALLQEDLCRLLRTQKGALFYDPDYGSSLPEYLGEGFQDGGAEAAAICELDLEEDPRVLNAQVSVESFDLKNIRLLARVESALGPFALIVNASDAVSALPYDEFVPYGVG